MGDEPSSRLSHRTWDQRGQAGAARAEAGEVSIDIHGGCVVVSVERKKTARTRGLIWDQEYSREIKSAKNVEMKAKRGEIKNTIYERGNWRKGASGAWMFLRGEQWDRAEGECARGFGAASSLDEREERGDAGASAADPLVKRRSPQCGFHRVSTD